MIKAFSLFVCNAATLAIFLMPCHLFVPAASAQISVIVANSSSQTATQPQIKEIFAATTLTWPSGDKVQVVDQPDTETGKKFYDKFVGKSISQVRLQWTKLILSGQALAPKKCLDDEAVKKAVVENPRAIGYVSSKALDASVKEIARIE